MRVLDRAPLGVVHGRDEEHLGARAREVARHEGVRPVVADHDPEPRPRDVEEGRLRPGDGVLDELDGDALPVLADLLPGRVEEDGRVVLLLLARDVARGAEDEGVARERGDLGEPRAPGGSLLVVREEGVLGPEDHVGREGARRFERLPSLGLEVVVALVLHGEDAERPRLLGGREADDAVAAREEGEVRRHGHEHDHEGASVVAIGDRPLDREARREREEREPVDAREVGVLPQGLAATERVAEREPGEPHEPELGAEPVDRDPERGRRHDEEGRASPGEPGVERRVERREEPQEPPEEERERRVEDVDEPVRVRGGREAAEDEAEAQRLAGGEPLERDEEGRERHERQRGEPHGREREPEERDRREDEERAHGQGMRLRHRG